MSTSGSFVPAVVPECLYTPRMTRAAALALRTAGGLRENCVVVIVDGPTIGTAGNTSPTEIELNPVSPTEFGTTARVHTTFAASAWSGIFDIDLGTVGTITELRDDWGNTAKDIDGDAATVHTQWPWHLGSATFRDNYAEDAVLTGWGTLAGTETISENRLVNSTVDLSGLGPITLQRNEISASTLTHTSAATLFVTGTRILSGFVLTHTGTGAVLITDSTLHSHSTAASDVLADGTSLTQISSSDIQGAPTNPAVQNSATGTGGVSVSGSKVAQSRIARLATTHASSFSVSQADVLGSTLLMAATATGTLALSNGTAHNSTITVNGGSFTGTAGRYSTATITTNGTRGLGFSSTEVRGAGVINNASGGTAGDVFNGSTIVGGIANGTLVTINGTIDPGGARTIMNFSTVRDGGTVTVVDSAGAVGPVGARVLLQSSEVSGQAAVTFNAGNNAADRCRFSNGCLVTLNAPFEHQSSIVEGAITKVPTAANFNRLANKAFDDWV